MCINFRLPAAPIAGMQVWQIALGVMVMYSSFGAVTNPEGWLSAEPPQSDLRGLRGTFISGFLFAFMGVMNMANTIATIREKRRYRQKAKSAVSASVLPAKTK